MSLSNNREITLGICKEKCFCKDCTNTKCFGAGDPGADCPRYHCVYNSTDKEFLDCKNCSWLK